VEEHSFDLVVLGSGAAGLTAALVGALRGLRVVVLEHADKIGGTSARSSGTLWIPDSHYLRAEGVEGDRERAENYLASLIGDRGDPAQWRTFLDAGPAMLRDLEARAGIGFRPFMKAPDYRQDHPGAAPGGRALEPLPFDGRLLGAEFARLGWPIRELMLFGGMMVSRAEAMALLRADRSPKAAWLFLKMGLRFLSDRLNFPRGTRLVIGNALVARLLKAALDQGVEVWTGAECGALIRDDGGVRGADVTHRGREIRVHAARGVVLAGGGFPGNPDWRARHLPEPTPAHTAAAESADGSTIDLALKAGAALGKPGLDNALWFPSSIAKRADGSTAAYPHILLDRSKPGLIAVDGGGRRFVNEAVSYHEFVRAMYAAGAVPAWLVCDRAFIRRYGLGPIRPRTPSIRKYVANGYLREAGTVEELAGLIGALAQALSETVTRFNGFAKAGRDADFAKGETIYDRANADPSVAPNPCLGPIARPPFYALPVYPTPLGTSLGLVADGQARVCDAKGAPIPGLYVCGNDMQSVFGGEYPGAGGQLGPGMTFAWIAARHAAGANDDETSETIDVVKQGDAT
jgi:succinate dehydrogenase/fumarate reductase flavoprotein subunit